MGAWELNCTLSRSGQSVSLLSRSRWIAMNIYLQAEEDMNWQAPIAVVNGPNEARWFWNKISSAPRNINLHLQLWIFLNSRADQLEVGTKHQEIMQWKGSLYHGSWCVTWTFLTDIFNRLIGPRTKHNFVISNLQRRDDSEQSTVQGGCFQTQIRNLSPFPATLWNLSLDFR